MVLVSCNAKTSGLSASNHCKTCGSLTLRELTFQVAILNTINEEPGFLNQFKYKLNELNPEATMSTSIVNIENICTGSHTDYKNDKKDNQHLFPVVEH